LVKELGLTYRNDFRYQLCNIAAQGFV